MFGEGAWKEEEVPLRPARPLSLRPWPRRATLPDSGPPPPGTGGDGGGCRGVTAGRPDTDLVRGTTPDGRVEEERTPDMEGKEGW